MSEAVKPSPEAVEKLYQRLFREAEAAGYHLNPDVEFTKDLVEGLLINEARYGYWNCPCRLASGGKQADLDIICPCDYRDPDLTDFAMCYCCLYVTEKVMKGEKKPMQIPERRPAEEERNQNKPKKTGTVSELPLPVWRCNVCGYLCAREHPPEVCPICKAKRERFQKFI